MEPLGGRELLALTGRNLENYPLIDIYLYMSEVCVCMRIVSLCCYYQTPDVHQDWFSSVDIQGNVDGWLIVTDIQKVVNI